jgi:DNA invertase Pin-like site-specific DNA recombinase
MPTRPTLPCDPYTVPSAAHHVNVLRFEFYHPSLPAMLFAGDQRCPRCPNGSSTASRLLLLLRIARSTNSTSASDGARWLMALVNTGKVQAVIDAKLDRLTRRVKDRCGLLELFKKRKVALISVAKALDTGSAAGRLVITIMGAVSQWEREAIGERTRDALRHKRSNGERVGNIEFGFRLGPDQRYLEPKPIEQAALADIRNLRSQGQTLRGIATTLNGCGLRTRRGTEWRLEPVVRAIKQDAQPRNAKPS